MDTAGRRTDIDALRALAVTAVVLFHAGVPGLSGGYVGVDVFFVISGFLITGLLVDEHQRTGRVRLGAFWARRARRILPGMLVSVAVVLPLSAAVQPSWDFSATVRSARASLVSAANLHFWDVSQGYFSAGTVRMPLLHLWSLGVEEQFYLALPLVAVVGLRFSGRRLTVAALAVLASASFAGAVAAMHTHARDAFFLPHLRAWELLAGSLLAFGRPVAARLGPMAAAIATGAGLGAIVAAVLTYDDATRFPGESALLPVAGTVAVIAAGVRPRADAWARRLAPNPMVQHLGRVSYAWYLWHWPALVLVREWTGTEHTVRDVAVAFASLGLATVSTRWVDDRFRRSTGSPRQVRRTLAVAGAALAAGVIATTAVAAASSDRSEVAIPLDEVLGGVGRAPHTTPSTSSTSTAVSDPTDPTSTTAIATTTTWPADTDWRSDDATQLLAESRRVLDLPCSSAAAGLPLDPACRLLAGDPVIVIVGDSHARQLVPAALQLASERGWGVAIASRPGCPSVPGIAVELGSTPVDGCTTWVDDVVAQLTAPGSGVALVLASARSAFYLPGAALAPGALGEAAIVGADDPSAAAASWSAGLTTLADELASVDVPLVWVQEVPDLPGWPSDCLPRGTVRECSTDRATFERFRSPMAEAERRALGERTGVALVDPLGMLCNDETCPPVRGRDVLYRDDNHLSLWGSAVIAPAIVEAAARVAPG